MSLTCVPQPGTSYPGLNAGILQAAWNGLFDAVPIVVYATAYMPINQYGNVSAGLETKWLGFIESINEIDRVHVEFVCQDPFFLLNQQIPARVVQSGCPWSFCDQNCTLASVANYTVTFTAKTGSTQSLLTPTSAFSRRQTDISRRASVTCVLGQQRRAFADGQAARLVRQPTDGPAILPACVGGRHVHGHQGLRQDGSDVREDPAPERGRGEQLGQFRRCAGRSATATGDINMGLTDKQREKVCEVAKSWYGTPYRGWTCIKGVGCDCGQLLKGRLHGSPDSAR